MNGSYFLPVQTVCSLHKHLFSLIVFQELMTNSLTDTASVCAIRLYSLTEHFLRLPPLSYTIY